MEDAVLPELTILAHHYHTPICPEHDAIRRKPHAGRYHQLEDDNNVNPVMGPTRVGVKYYVVCSQ